MKESIVATIFSQNGNQVLLIKRRDVPVWVLPGGALEEAEDPVQGIIREVYEETGLHVSIIRKVARYTPINKLGTTTHLFDCKVEEGIPATGDETADIGYFPLDALPKKFFFIHREMVNDSLTRKNDLICKQLDNVTYWALLRFFIRHPILVIRFALSQLGLPINS